MSYTFGLLILAAVYVCTTSALPPCVCTRNLRPVCGSDGVTYSNECLLDCERTKTHNEITLVKQGPCESDNPTVPHACICTYEYKPVCGTDGNTYPNRCSLSCEQPPVEVKHEGACNTEEVKVASLPPCICTREMKPVCGSDGATYSNPCLLNCASQTNSGLKEEHVGPCDYGVNVVEQSGTSKSCTCSRDLEPVCGSDGVTYNNECLMRCAGNHISVVKHEPCEA